MNGFGCLVYNGFTSVVFLVFIVTNGGRSYQYCSYARCNKYVRFCWTVVIISFWRYTMRQLSHKCVLFSEMFVAETLYYSRYTQDIIE